MNSRIKPTILTSGDRALGLGDAFILAPTLIELSKKYKVRHIATNNSYNVLKLLINDDLQIFNMDQQGHLYQNDHLRAINLVYWESRNTLRNFGESAINTTRRLADLPPYSGILPDIPLDVEIENSVKELYSNFNGPIVVQQPLLSYWNKMITKEKQLEITDRMLKNGYTVIQIAGKGLPQDMIHKGALNFVGKTSLMQSMAMIKHADLFVGCDSFGQHCASFMKTPAVVCFCGTSPEDFGYNFNTNIFHPEIAFCQYKCARPMRWLYDYSFKNPDQWNSRSEAGWVCPNKICERVITVDEVITAIDKELEIGNNRDWTYCDYKHFDNYEGLE